MRHVDPDLLILAVEGQLPPGTLLRVILAHLKDLCPECRAAIDLLQGPEADEEAGARQASWERHDQLVALREHLAEHGEDAADDSSLPPDPRYALAIAAAEQGIDGWTSRVEAEQRRARRDLADLHRMEAGERAGRVMRACTRFRSRALVELILGEARQMARRDPREARSFAELVPVLLDFLPGVRDGIWRETARLRALAWRANALRLLGLPHESARSFAGLRAALAASAIDDTGLHAEVCQLEAALSIDHGRHAQASRLLDQAALLYRIDGDRAGLARVLMLRGIVKRREGEAEAAVDTQREVIALLAADPEADPYDQVSAVTNLALSLCDCERYEDAAATMAAHQELYAQQRGARWRVKECALRGRVAHGLGRLGEAEEMFRTARDESLALKDYFVAALSSLDLAAVLLEQRRLAELREVASLLAPALDAHDLRQEAIAAILLFTRAAISEEISVEAVRRLRWKLEVAGRSGAAPTPVS